FSKSAVAATYINPFQARRECQPIDKNCSYSAAPISHISFIREPIFKPDLGFSHHRPLCDYSRGQVKRSKNCLLPQSGEMSALPPKADMCGATSDVRFGPKADIGRYSLDHFVGAGEQPAARRDLQLGIRNPRDTARGFLTSAISN